MIFFVIYLITIPLSVFPFSFRQFNALIFVRSRALVIKFIHDCHDESIYRYFLLDDSLKYQKIIHLRTIYEI